MQHLARPKLSGLMKASLIEQLRSDIAEQDIAANRRNHQRFFKETLDEPVSLATPVLRQISNRRFREIRSLAAPEILRTCETLLASHERYMRFFAFDWAEKLQGSYTCSDFKRFQSWLNRYVDSWSSCDHLCCGALGRFIQQHPDFAIQSMRWTKSVNRWIRRASAVCLIHSARQGELMNQVFAVADRLRADDDDLVQKACGWMLKEAAGRNQKRVFDYVMRNRQAMARTTLRCAIEKMPEALRRRAMA
jgi:3-methyladenine DNA glycosylase AlkD